MVRQEMIASADAMAKPLHAEPGPTRNSSPQTLLVLCGLPGSGKSTLAEQFKQQGWAVICQDELGDRKACEAACSAALAAGDSVVIDRCNFDMAQRTHWLQLARRHAERSGLDVRLLALALELPPAVCLARAEQRGGHATLPPGQAKQVIQRFLQQWQRPLRREGFHAVHIARSSEEGQTLAQQLLAQRASATTQSPAAAAFVPSTQLSGGLPAQQQRGFRSTPGADAPDSRQQPGDRGQGSAAAPPGQPGQGPVPGAARAPGAGNVVPFPGRKAGSPRPGAQPPASSHHLPRRHPWSRHSHDEPSGRVLDAGLDASRPVLMFDANGVLTTHTSQRRSTGTHKARPGVHHLRRLQARFHLGLFSSASDKTVQTALQLLEAAAGPGPQPLFNRRLVLTRQHTFLAPEAHVAAGGKAWDTVKPLAPYFSRLHRVLLVDDDAHKRAPGEGRNMLLMPRWLGDDQGDDMLARLVEVLCALGEELAGDPEADLRDFTEEASQQLARMAQEQAEARRAAQEGAGADPDAALPEVELAACT